MTGFNSIFAAENIISMRKQSLLFVAGAVLFLASCQNTASENTVSQEQIDSAVNAREAEIRAEMQAANDSLIDAEAMRRVDSIMNTGKQPVPATTTKQAPPRTTGTKTGGTKPAVTPPRSTQDEKFDQRQDGGRT
ncbi:MAG: hypothetical protein EOP00_26070, partial [Pedobacter sp.]